MSEKLKSKLKMYEFLLEAPNADQVFVAGTFNNWSPIDDLMTKKNDKWKKRKKLAQGRHESNSW